MDAMPVTVPISELRLHQSEVLEKLSEGPVLLTQRGRGAAVLTSLETWNRLMQRMEDLHDALDVMEARQNPEPTVDLDEYLARRGEHVPA